MNELSSAELLPTTITDTSVASETNSEQQDRQQCLSLERAIACLKGRLEHYQQVPIELKAQLQPHLEVLGGLQQKLAQPLIQIAVFGLVSRGKSAVLNALFGETLFPTGPLNGVTQWPRSVRWSPTLNTDEVASVHLELTDTPGLDEIAGEARATMAQEIAHCADLILFVSAGPPMPVEREALIELAQLAKPMIWVVNKADLYPDLTPESLYQSLDDPILQTVLSPREIVLTAAAPAPVQVRHEWPDGQVTVDWEMPPPQVESLRSTLMALLHREGLSLLSLNTLLLVQATEQKMIAAIAQFYAESAESVQWKLWGLKAVLIGLNPWIWLDLGLNFGMDIVQVRQLSQTYGLPTTRHQVGLLWKTVWMSLGLMGAAELGTTGLSWLLQGLEGFPWVAAVMTQAAIAVYGASLVGQSAEQYLCKGATWDANGPSVLIQQLLSELEPDRVVYRLANTKEFFTDSQINS